MQLTTSHGLYIGSHGYITGCINKTKELPTLEYQNYQTCLERSKNSTEETIEHASAPLISEPPCIVCPTITSCIFVLGSQSI